MCTALAILDYVNSCRIDLLWFVESAYFRRFGKSIPSNALEEDIRHITSAEGVNELPRSLSYLDQFLENSQAS